MPLVSCPDCGRSVSDAAPACIHCGRPMAQQSNVSPLPVGISTTDQPARSYGRRMIAGVIASVLILLCFWSASTSGEGITPAVLAAVGVSLGTWAAWLSTRKSARGLRWPRILFASVLGSIVALILGIAAYGNLGRPEALGVAVGAGLSYGLLFGGAAAFLIYALKDLPALD